MTKAKIPTFKAGDRFETNERTPNAQGVILKKERRYRQYACEMQDYYQVRFDDGHEETLWRMQYYCKPLKAQVS